MRIKRALKILIANPLSVIRDGIRAQYEKHHRNELRTKHNIDQLPTINILELFPGFKEDLSVYSFLDGTSLVTDLMLLKSLARTYDNCSYLEIGSWKGESIANVAEVANDCTSITLSDEEMREWNLGEDFIRVHGLFSKDNRNVATIRHNSHTFNFGQLHKKFDLIFIDGDHTYEGILADTKNVFSLRKNDNSIIVWHDYGFTTEDVRHSVLNGILDGIDKDKHHNLFHVSNTMCAVYVEGRTFNTSYTKFPTYPDKTFSIQLQAKKF